MAENWEAAKTRLIELTEFIKSKGLRATERLFPEENGTEAVLEVAAPAVEASREAIARREMIAKAISSLLGIAASFGVTYFAVKWMTNAMDPTRKEKQKARERAEAVLKKVGVKNVKLPRRRRRCQMCTNEVSHHRSLSDLWEVFRDVKSLLHR